MDTHEWPLRRLNFFAIPLAIVTVFFVEPFWHAMLICAGTGFVLAAVIATLWIGRFRATLKANPIRELQAQIEGVANVTTHLRFVLLQALSGALIQSVWGALAFGLARFFRSL